MYYVLSGTFSCANICWPDILSAQHISLLESLTKASVYKYIFKTYKKLWQPYGQDSLFVVVEGGIKPFKLGNILNLLTILDLAAMLNIAILD